MPGSTHKTVGSLADAGGQLHLDVPLFLVQVHALDAERGQHQLKARVPPKPPRVPASGRPLAIGGAIITLQPNGCSWVKQQPPALSRCQQACGPLGQQAAQQFENRFPSRRLQRALQLLYRWEPRHALQAAWRQLGAAAWSALEEHNCRVGRVGDVRRLSDVSSWAPPAHEHRSSSNWQVGAIQFI